MKCKLQLAAILFGIATLNSQVSTAHAQGALAPTAGPAPMMKSLAQIEPRTPISSLPVTINTSGSYYLTTNLTGTAGSEGISITANDVTLDLKGFTLSGVAGSRSGIAVFGSDITIFNGVLRNWGTNGVAGNGGGRNLTVKNVSANNNGASGIDVGVLGVAEDCLADTNLVNGIMAANGGVVRNCTASGNVSAGIRCYSSVGSGIPSGAIVTGCLVSKNNLGIVVQANSYIAQNNIAQNNVMNSSADGISCVSQGSRIEDNHLSFNNNGISTSALTNMVVRNSFISSTNAVILGISTGLPIGPLIGASGVATNLNPNANFSF